uniref:Uncharacterized protein n=1 Tax=Romanomermis culicivorax TaxID=13658 RepID=A0A915JKS6_ROMCU
MLVGRWRMEVQIPCTIDEVRMHRIMKQMPIFGTFWSIMRNIGEMTYIWKSTARYLGEIDEDYCGNNGTYPERIPIRDSVGIKLFKTVSMSICQIDANEQGSTAKLRKKYRGKTQGKIGAKRQAKSRGKMPNKLELNDEVMDEDWKEDQVDRPLTRNRKDPLQMCDDIEFKLGY